MIRFSFFSFLGVIARLDLQKRVWNLEFGIWVVFKDKAIIFFNLKK